MRPQPQISLTNPSPPQASNPTHTPKTIGAASNSYANNPEATLAAAGRRGMDMAGQQKEAQRDTSHSGQEPPTSEERLPYFRRTRVQNLLAMRSENAAFQDHQWLRQHCALCSQWIACRSKVKQHDRLSRQAQFGMCAEAEEAGRLSSRFNTPASPCEHCGPSVKAYRQRPSKCSVLPWSSSRKCSDPLVEDQLSVMDWAPSKREAEQDSAIKLGEGPGCVESMYHVGLRDERWCSRQCFRASSSLVRCSGGLVLPTTRLPSAGDHFW